MAIYDNFPMNVPSIDRLMLSIIIERSDRRHMAYEVKDSTKKKKKKPT